MQFLRVFFATVSLSKTDFVTFAAGLRLACGRASDCFCCPPSFPLVGFMQMIFSIFFPPFEWF
jgi:hypothetical protein